jgi:hypothetical protein
VRCEVTPHVKRVLASHLSQPKRLKFPTPPSTATKEPVPATSRYERHCHAHNSTQAVMSRFFTASDSSSEESSEEELYSEEEKAEAEESSSDSDEGSDDEEDGDSGNEGATGADRFLVNKSESEDSDDEERVKSLKSAKDKRFDELEGIVRQMENALKINDWAVVSTGAFISGMRRA